MNREETVKILSVLEKAYPKFNPVSTNDFEKIMLWQEMMSDLDYELANIAIKKHIAEEVYQPTIASIRKSVASIKSPQNQITADDAWGEIKRAIKRFGYYQEENAFDSMSPITRKIAKNMNWKEICLSENQMADRAHFMKMFEVRKDREQKQAMLPDGLQKQIIQEIEKHQCEIEGPVNVFAGLIGTKEDKE